MAATPVPFNLANIDNALVTVYTCPASTVAFVHNLILANISGAAINVDVTYTKNASGVTTYLVFNAPIPAGGSLVVLGDNNKQAMQAADIIRVRATSGTNVLDCTGSVLEQT